MEIISSSLLVWIAPAFLMWFLTSSKWLNARPSAAGRFAEVVAWLGLGSAAVSVVLWAILGRNPIVATATEGGWIGVRLDALSAAIFLLVCFLGAVIIRFSKNYLSGDEKQGYFFKWLCITLGAVMAMVISPGLVQFGVAWVTTSIGLHRLLVFFPDRVGTRLSARKKFIISRIGDLCLIGAFIGVYRFYGVQDFGHLFAAVQEEGGSLANHAWIGWLIVLGALLKSAQFPFHTWLPDTMGAPTPVSALMHAGIINGGGYLVVRMSPVLINTPNALHLLAIAGGFTAIYASMVMLTQTSVKRSLAYSTIAQMGFMLLQCGLGAFDLAVLHIVAHSLYKGHAFLSSGSAVETAKKLNADANYLNLSQAKIWAAVGISLAIVVGLSFAFGVSPSEKPGMLVLGMVVVMALTQLIWMQMRRGQSGKALGATVLKAAGLAALYFALAAVSKLYLAPALPEAIEAAPVLEGIIAFVLFAFLITSIRFQDGEPGFLSINYKRRLYVHALNGFYLTTLANRAAQKLGRIPSSH